MKRTSISHPLQISEIETCDEPTAGIIGVTFCPGKKSDSLYGSPWDRDLETDLAAINAWGADTLITLVETHEFEELAVGDLPAKAAAYFQWFHLPIKDVSVPDGVFDIGWSKHSRGFHETLTAGGKIVVHCRGGLGRAGLVAALLLIERGIAAPRAIAMVRNKRPGAIETPDQERWLVERAKDTRRKVPLLNASLRAGAMGDSLGAEIEFLSSSQIIRRYPGGLVDLPEHHGQVGTITDDTQMTLFTMEGLLRADAGRETPDITNTVNEVHHALLRWYATQGRKPIPEIDRKFGLILDQRLNQLRAPGNTCLSSLGRARKFGDMARNDSKGCGTIMRVAPIGLWCPRHQVRELAIKTSALTHGHVTGQLAAAAWAEMLADVAAGGQLEDVANAILKEYAAMEGGAETAASIKAALDAPRDGMVQTVESLGGGWIAEEALAIALYSGLVAPHLEAGLRCAVLHSGDSDSTAAIAGNMLGLLFPEDALRHRWGKEIEFREWFGIMTSYYARMVAERDVVIEEMAGRFPSY